MGGIEPLSLFETYLGTMKKSNQASFIGGNRTPGLLTQAEKPRSERS